MAVEFRQVQDDQRSVRFENLTHDFPQGIGYRRDGDALQAEISGPGKDGGEHAILYTYTACADDTKRPQVSDGAGR